MNTPNREKLLELWEEAGGIIIGENNNVLQGLPDDLERFVGMLSAPQAEERELVTYLKENDQGGYDHADEDDPFAFPVYRSRARPAQPVAAQVGEQCFHLDSIMQYTGDGAPVMFCRDCGTNSPVAHPQAAQAKKEGDE